MKGPAPGCMRVLKVRQGPPKGSFTFKASFRNSLRAPLRIPFRVPARVVFKCSFKSSVKGCLKGSVRVLSEVLGVKAIGLGSLWASSI